MLAISFAIVAFGQDDKPEGWSHKGSFGINLGQSSYTNWAAGGQNALSGLGLFNYGIFYRNGNFKWAINGYLPRFHRH